MVRGATPDDDVPLDVIDLEPELEVPPRPPAERPRGPLLGAAALVVLVLAGAVVASAHHHRAGSSAVPPATAAGRFRPIVRGAGTTRLVLPSGVVVELSGDVRATLAGLSGTYAGGIGSVSFRVARGAPSELFATLGPQPITKAVAVAGADARAPDLAAYGGRLAVLSSGGWTLVAFLSDDQGVADFQLRQLAVWRLRATPDGAVVEAPSNLVGDASVLLASDPGAPDRHLELTADNCVGEIQRSASEVGDTTSGYWCDHGVYVRIAGPKAYVDHALATLQLKVTASSPPERAS